MKALVGSFNQEKALVGAFSVIVQPVVEPMENYTALVMSYERCCQAPPVLCVLCVQVWEGGWAGLGWAGLIISSVVLLLSPDTAAGGGHYGHSPPAQLRVMLYNPLMKYNCSCCSYNSYCVAIF